MARVLIKLRIMPESPDTDLENLSKLASQKIKKLGGEPAQQEIEPVAFGLKALIFIIIADEKLGGTEPLELELAKIKGVESVEVLDVRRAVG